MPNLDPVLFELTLKEAAQKYEYISAASKMPRDELEEMLISVIYQLKVQEKVVRHLLQHINDQTYESIFASKPS